MASRHVGPVPRQVPVPPPRSPRKGRPSLRDIANGLVLIGIDMSPMERLWARASRLRRASVGARSDEMVI
ncbi:hypothetical protein NL676_035488 [Syzygium grande]|nr:hypothetical protein NL676_035488 [Syzygium grande]